MKVRNRKKILLRGRPRRWTFMFSDQHISTQTGMGVSDFLNSWWSGRSNGYFTEEMLDKLLASGAYPIATGVVGDEGRQVHPNKDPDRPTVLSFNVSGWFLNKKNSEPMRGKLIVGEEAQKRLAKNMLSDPQVKSNICSTSSEAWERIFAMTLGTEPKENK